jgi:hypothetical protein
VLRVEKSDSEPKDQKYSVALFFMVKAALMWGHIDAANRSGVVPCPS